MKHKPFLKTILPSSFNFGSAVSSLVDVHRRGVDSTWMSKRAAAGVFNNLDLKSEPDHSFIHVIAMGASDKYGYNRNGDGFLSKSGQIDIPEPSEGVPSTIKIAKGLEETYGTFETDANVYWHHKNKDPEKKEGDIVKAAYNEPVSRVELMLRVPNDKWHDDLEKLANNQDVPFSMSTMVPFDVCSICGNKAPSRADYCEHAKNHLGTITKEGRQVGVMNDNMVFFDISKVHAGADRIAKALLKAASIDATQEKVVSAAELAEELTLFPPERKDPLLGQSLMPLDKAAVVKKLSDIEKEIESVGVSDSPLTKLTLALPPDIMDDDFKQLCVPSSQRMDLLGGLADAKICLSMKDFVKLLMGNKFSAVEPSVPGAQDLLPGMFGRMCSGSTMPPFDMGDFDLGSELLPKPARDMIGKLTSTHSLAEAPAKKRITLMVIRGNKPVENMKSSVLKQSTNSLESVLASAYALYKAAFCDRAGLNENKMLTKLALLQHYAKQVGKPTALAMG